MQALEECTDHDDGQLDVQAWKLRTEQHVCLLLEGYELGSVLHW